MSQSKLRGDFGNSAVARRVGFHTLADRCNIFYIVYTLAHRCNGFDAMRQNPLHLTAKVYKKYRIIETYCKSMKSDSLGDS